MTLRTLLTLGDTFCDPRDGLTWPPSWQARPTKPPRTRRETHDGSYGARSEKNPTLGGVAPPPRSHSLSEKQGNDLMDDIFESLFTREMAEECSREAAAARAVTMSIELMHASAAQTNVQSMAQQQAQQQEQVPVALPTRLPPRYPVPPPPLPPTR